VPRKLPSWVSASAFTLFNILIIILLVSLGQWQHRRLSQKESLLQTIGNAQSHKPFDLAQLPLQDLHSRDLAYHPVALGSPHLLSGTYHRLAQTHQGRLGVRLFIPCRLPQGWVIFIDFGWFSGKEPPLHARDLKLASVEGFLTPYPQAGSFTPTQVQKTGNDTWDFYTPDDVLFQRLLPQEKVVHGVYLTATKPYFSGLIPTTKVPELPNRHFEYMVTWFTLAVVWGALTVYGVLTLRRRQRC
jgi:surfeit locus 1 family protein